MAPNAGIRQRGPSPCAKRKPEYANTPYQVSVPTSSAASAAYTANATSRHRGDASGRSRAVTAADQTAAAATSAVSRAVQPPPALGATRAPAVDTASSGTGSSRRIRSIRVCQGSPRTAALT